MKALAMWIVLLLAIVAAGGTGYWLGHRGVPAAGAKDEEKAAPSDSKPVASVVVIPVHRRMIAEDFIAYGSVVAPPSDVLVVSVPFEARITNVLVTPGQIVMEGKPLVEVEASAATALAFEEARNTLAAGERDLQLVQQRYDQKLATNSELFTAQNAVKSAQAKLQSLQQSGAAGPHELKAGTGGVVTKLDVQVGQIVPIGGPLVEVAGHNQIAVELGVEPKDAVHLTVGQPVELRPVDSAGTVPAAGKIRLVSQRMDPATRLVKVTVSPPADSKLLLDSSVGGRITRSWSSAEGFVVPREAALPEDDGTFSLFTVKDGHAVKHAVKIGIENSREVQVLSEELKEDDLVVIVGNHELEDGMAVQVEPASQSSPSESPDKEPADTEPAASQPVTSQPASQTGGPR